jgi:hypothetical protein
MIARNFPLGSASSVADNARAQHRARTAKEKAESESLLGHEQEKVAQSQASLKQEKKRKFWLNPQIPDRSKPLNMSTWDKAWLAFALLFGCFLLFMEQGAAATVLVDLGVFGISTMWEARAFLCSAAAAGFVLGLVTGKLPMVIRARLTATLVVVLVIALAGLIPSIAANVGIAAGIANKQVDFGNIDEEEQLEDISDSSDESPLWSWVMFSCSLASICLTVWLMELYREIVIDEATPKIKNDEYGSCELRITELESWIDNANETIADLKGRIAKIDAEENREVIRALNDYRDSL